MNSTAQPALDPKLPTGLTLVASRPTPPPRTAAPGEWKPTDRWAWACGLPVSGIARAVANCIARHANNKTGMGWPGMGTIVSETGFKRTAVIAAIKDLERGGHVSVFRSKVGKKNEVNRYQLPPMVNVSASHPSAPHGLWGGPPGGPESVSIESVHKAASSRARAVCKICGNDWPAKYGTKCYSCGLDASTRTTTADEPTADEPTADEPTADEPTACSCGDAYHHIDGGWCADCKGEPSAAQRDAVREKHGWGGAREGWGVDGGVVPKEGGQEKELPLKSDPDALLRFWKEARAQFNREHHMGGTNDGRTDDRT